MIPSVSFSKYQACGNDFILIDNRSGSLRFSRSEIARLCHRKFGVGADGLILLNSVAGFDFEMKNYNSDGGECTMCGNGARALIQFASDLGVSGDEFKFLAIDGPHVGRTGNTGVEIKMQSVNRIVETPVGPSLDTGSPHLVCEVKGLLNFDVFQEGRTLRNSKLFMPGGINANFFEEQNGRIFLRTYERGVEDETLSCGTGAIATAIIWLRNQGLNFGQSYSIPVHCQGGELLIRLTPESDQKFTEIWLSGQVEKTFEGKV